MKAFTSSGSPSRNGDEIIITITPPSPAASLRRSPAPARPRRPDDPAVWGGPYALAVLPPAVLPNSSLVAGSTATVDLEAQTGAFLAPPPAIPPGAQQANAGHNGEFLHSTVAQRSPPRAWSRRRRLGLLWDKCGPWLKIVLILFGLGVMVAIVIGAWKHGEARELLRELRDG
ncbi:hypothetical protein K402DRAFT_51114 [Aulographum hederae CBS 113979]|uniref:Uncharacterized protein n=1 Tax=Aulographum hederae CBS 113979 TaxID=1176131 RepID=A0A6G1H3E1_9PEZI|nr:hypothetical protein K402DRAFT_51114 [Aulographum hederae CBS 113979]